MECASSPSSSVQSKIKTRETILRMKMRSPQIRRKLREEFKTYYQNKRHNLNDKFRSLETISEDVCSIVSDVCNDFCDVDVPIVDVDKKILSPVIVDVDFTFDSEDIFTPSDLDQASSVSEMEFMNQVNQIALHKMQEMEYFLSLKDSILCIFCSKGNMVLKLSQNKEIYTCENCNETLPDNFVRECYPLMINIIQDHERTRDQCHGRVYLKRLNEPPVGYDDYDVMCDGCRLQVALN